MSDEAPETYQARRKLREIFDDKCYNIEEEVELEMVTNNMEEEIWPPYRADMLLTQQFIIELDSKKLHGTHRAIIHDKWKDKNVRSQAHLMTVRLLSKDVVKQEPGDIMAEIDSQLYKQYRHTHFKRRY